MLSTLVSWELLQNTCYLLILESIDSHRKKGTAWYAVLWKKVGGNSALDMRISYTRKLREKPQGVVRCLRGNLRSRSDDSHGKLSGVCWRGVTEENDEGGAAAVRARERRGAMRKAYSGGGKVANGGKTGGTRRKTNTGSYRSDNLPFHDWRLSCC